MKKYLKLIRVKHYVKNLLVFAALACSGQFFNAEKLLPGILAFISFCAISSAVYIINDIQDKEKDRKHPTKCKRPIASGAVPVQTALIIALAAVIVAVLCCFLTFSGFVPFLLLILYLILNLAYSFGLKNFPIIDISILVSGFLIRILYGAVVTQITISNWLYLTVISLAFYFALGKRRNEAKQLANAQTRKVLKSYPINFLDKNMGMFLALANVFYALWSMDSKTVSSYETEYLIFTVPIVWLITLKYSLSVEGDSDGDPVEVLLHDKVLMLLCALYAVCMLAILYF